MGWQPPSPPTSTADCIEKVARLRILVLCHRKTQKVPKALKNSSFFAPSSCHVPLTTVHTKQHPAKPFTQAFDMATGFGLDIGSESAYVVQDTGGIIRNELGGHSSGSLVAFNESERVIGEAAVGQQSSNPKNTLGDLHLLLGQSLAAVEASPRAPHLPFKRVAGDDDGKVAVVVNLRGQEKTFTPEALLAMLLAQLKGLAATGSAASAGGGDAGRAAALAAPPAFGLAVPLWFGPEARVALRDAAAIAELGDGRVVFVDAPEALCHVFAQKHPVEAAVAAPAEGGAEESANSRVHLFVDVGATHATAVVARFFAPGAGPDGRTFEVR